MNEQLQFNPDVWYQNLAHIAAKTPEHRYRALVKLHKETIDNYMNQLQKITTDQAEGISSDGRKIKIVVAHIAGWEEWQLQVFHDPNRTQRIKQQMSLQDYEDPKLGMLSFNSVDSFNARQEELYKDWSWDAIREKAIKTAMGLQDTFPEEPSEEWLFFLNNTPQKKWNLTNNIELTITGGWYLWMVSLEHEAVEHRKDLVFS